MLLLLAKDNHSMNKRIEELAEQAGYEKDEFGVGHWDMPQCKKFAESLIEECIQVLKDTGYPNAHGTCVGVEELKQHFGVEE